jgi:hypothetical protein
MTKLSLDQLAAFIVRAKSVTYAAGGAKSLSYRPGSHDLQFHEGEFAYLDSYFGGADFIGQEVIYYQGQPVWAMNYYGRILEPALIKPEEAGQIIQASLSALYKEGRFLGGFEHDTGQGVYTDTNEGDVTSFTGKEWIMRHSEMARQGVRVYELVYHGGLIRG